MKWHYNALSGNDIGYYKGRTIVRRTEYDYYEVELRFGLKKEVVPFENLYECKDAINDEIRRTLCRD